LAAHLDAALNGDPAAAEPDAMQRFAIVLDHFRQTLAFYGEGLGLKMFRKHLGWYVEQAPWPTCPLGRRQAQARLCRLDAPEAVEAALSDLWLQPAVRLVA